MRTLRLFKDAFRIGLIGFILIGCANAKTAFEKALKENTIESYQRFLNEYNESEYAAQASKLREEVFFRPLQIKIEAY